MTIEKKNNIDPITLEIMRNRIQSIADEMTAALVRAAYSTNIKDRMDCSSAVLTIDGEVVVQTELGTPFHLGVMPSAVQIMLEHFPIEKLEKGDAIISNIPFPIGPGHLSDVAILSPVYYGEEIVAIVANQAHHVDMGGYAPGSMPFGVTEIYQEGLQIPPVKLFRKGKPDQGIISLILQNIRTVKVTKGDIMAQIAANNVGINRLNEMLDKYDKNAVLGCLHDILDYGERNMRAGISKLPKGKYSFEDYLEGDGIDDKLIKIKASVEIKKDCCIVDFKGTDRQVKGPLNARISSAQACVYFALKAIINPDLSTNSGSYRAIEVKVEEGSLVQAKYPAAVCNANILTGQRVVDVILGAMLKAVPQKIPAACSGEMNLVNIGGIQPDDGHYYNYVSTYGGGQGALFCQDGMDGVQTHMTNTRNAPAEVLEVSYPLRVEEYGLVSDSEGAGRYRGGYGMIHHITLLGNEPKFSMGADRREIGPWGVDGGGSGGTSFCYIIDKHGKKNVLPSKVTTTLEKGDEVIIITPGGGGWGDPKERKAESISKDVKDKLISKKRAKEIYGWKTE